MPFARNGMLHHQHQEFRHLFILANGHTFLPKLSTARPIISSPLHSNSRRYQVFNPPSNQNPIQEIPTIPTMSESTFHTTREDLRKAESQVSRKNNGNVPADSEVAQTKVISFPFLPFSYNHAPLSPPPNTKYTSHKLISLPHPSPSSTKTLNPNPPSSPSAKPTCPSRTTRPCPRTGTPATAAKWTSAPAAWRATSRTGGTCGSRPRARAAPGLRGRCLGRRRVCRRGWGGRGMMGWGGCRGMR